MLVPITVYGQLAYLQHHHFPPRYLEMKMYWSHFHYLALVENGGILLSSTSDSDTEVSKSELVS
jgi:hypothetical protein